MEQGINKTSDEFIKAFVSGAQLVPTCISRRKKSDDIAAISQASGSRRKQCKNLLMDILPDGTLPISSDTEKKELF